ncbi:hypothetical protein NZK35_25830 [Stieleria sp. ICT_E10.1]|uniref:hypothetical protein n=1 Tax=Stieleria sedimenti TaxID=2976331 RepID=UPI0021807DDD|nr:hypothetical protein [Stieleria sedimenti]MCS7470079.1 hypothetical protein [Stieleria sedimenti]
MKPQPLSCLFLMLLVAVVVGCGDTGRRTSTEGADAQAIAEYEAAVAAAEGNMATSSDASEGDE